MIVAAGILIISKKNNVLFLKRGPGGDTAGLWCFPGGKIEGSETSLDAAIRETQEEAGKKFSAAQLSPWTRRVGAAHFAPSTDAPQGGVAAPTSVDFTTFIVRDVEEFLPELGPADAPEHTAFAWAPSNDPPQPLHPGCAIALQRLTMDELGIAKAIASGDLTSPQEYENLTLFKVRVTGTGRAVRSEKLNEKGEVTQEEEIVWRDPSIYLNEEFCQRCAGVPVILEHPPGMMLTTKEFKKRNIGALMFAWVEMTGDNEGDVWAIARVLDKPAAIMMSENQLSTSPSVVWSDPEVNASGTLENGKRFFIEGKPSLLDHLAVCWQGVWDKDGEPTGVTTVRGDDAMAEKDVKAELLDTTAILAGIQALSAELKGITARQDSIERKSARYRADSLSFSKRRADDTDVTYTARHDAEEKMAADAEEEAGEDKEKAAKTAKDKRKDAEEEEAKEKAAADKKGAKDAEEEEKEKKAAADAEEAEKKAAADATEAEEKEKKAAADARADSVTVADLKAKLERLEAASKPLSDDDINAFAGIQSRADSVYSALGSRARAPLQGESLLAYRRHFINDLKQYSTTWKDKDLSTVAANDAVFTTVEQQVLAEAEAAARSPATVKPGELRMRTVRMDSGHIRNEFFGKPSAWMDNFAGPVKQAATKFLTPNRGSDR